MDARLETNPLDPLITGTYREPEEEPEQRSPEWFVWRRKGIGSSEASILMGLNGYKTLHQLWLEKTGQVEVDYQTIGYMAERGVRMESRARKAYERFTGIKVVDRLFIHPKFTFIRASLDGWSDEFSLILEIKCPRYLNHYRAKAESYVKPEYYCQIQHQFLASGAENADFWSFDGRSGHRIPVLPDVWFMGELLEREIAFWECVESLKEPNPDQFAPLK